VRLAVLGDVHGELDRLATVLGWLAREPIDLALLVGDIGVDPTRVAPLRRLLRERHDASVRAVLERVESRLDCPVVFVPGNHDLPDPPGDVPAVNADRETVEVLGLRIAGLGGAGPARFGFPYEWSDEAADRALEELLPATAEPPDVLLCHTPPAGSRLDRTARGEHVGSRSVRAWLARRSPRLFVCGHIHEAAGIERVEGVPCLNAGALGEPYAAAVGWTVEWSDGPQEIVAFLPGTAGDVPHRERTGLSNVR
jgi:Icc-related predicted phosphoesterase